MISSIFFTALFGEPKKVFIGFVVFICDKDKNVIK